MYILLSAHGIFPKIEHIIGHKLSLTNLIVLDPYNL